MNLVQVLALAIALTALAVVLLLRFLRQGQSPYVYGFVALGFLGGIFFGIILRLHDFLANGTANLLFDVVLVIFVIYALSLCYEEIRFHRQYLAEAVPVEATSHEPSNTTLDGNAP